ncbi:MAG: methylated-DNA--[protein]-cysteine S-methyltransferase [Symploca sp. SIO2B6]|nr:methylated-DNA--[protein]-cysteine S-methyltransferase [Symploca sp. SIO2B6]
MKPSPNETIHDRNGHKHNHQPNHEHSHEQHHADYERIARAIAFMRQYHRSQPDLKTIAQHVHLSEYHFQRLFKAWAGISPKRFSQYLTLEYAKAQMAETKNLLELSAEAGLSSPGRLHDLFVTVEAMSPGEFKTGGKGLTIRYGVHNSPFGHCLIALTQCGVCNLHFFDCGSEQYANGQGTDEQGAKRIAAQYMQDAWPNADRFYEPWATKEVRDRIFPSSPSSSRSLSLSDEQLHLKPPSPLILHLKGTNFQLQVWRALLNIPFAGITTYQDLAISMGRPTAARAIGTAIGRNPIGYLIPCHRVIRASGELGGYRWGLERKTALLGWEACQRQSLEKLSPKRLPLERRSPDG